MTCLYLLHGCDAIQIFKLCVEERGITSPYFSGDIFYNLRDDINTFSNYNNPLMMCGDLNARTSNLQDFISDIRKHNIHDSVTIQTINVEEAMIQRLIDMVIKLIDMVTNRERKMPWRFIWEMHVFLSTGIQKLSRLCIGF